MKLKKVLKSKIIFLIFFCFLANSKIWSMDSNSANPSSPKKETLTEYFKGYVLQKLIPQLNSAQELAEPFKKSGTSFSTIYNAARKEAAWRIPILGKKLVTPEEWAEMLLNEEENVKLKDHLKYVKKSIDMSSITDAQLKEISEKHISDNTVLISYPKANAINDISYARDWIQALKDLLNKKPNEKGSIPLTWKDLERWFPKVGIGIFRKDLTESAYLGLNIFGDYYLASSIRKARIKFLINFIKENAKDIESLLSKIANTIEYYGTSDFIDIEKFNTFIEDGEKTDFSSNDPLLIADNKNSEYSNLDLLIDTSTSSLHSKKEQLEKTSDGVSFQELQEPIVTSDVNQNLSEQKANVPVADNVDAPKVSNNTKNSVRKSYDDLEKVRYQALTNFLTNKGGFIQYNPFKADLIVPILIYLYIENTILSANQAKEKNAEGAIAYEAMSPFSNIPSTYVLDQALENRTFVKDKDGVTKKSDRYIYSPISFLQDLIRPESFWRFFKNSNIGMAPKILDKQIGYTLPSFFYSKNERELAKKALDDFKAKNPHSTEIPSLLRGMPESFYSFFEETGIAGSCMRLMKLGFAIKSFDFVLNQAWIKYLIENKERFLALIHKYLELCDSTKTDELEQVEKDISDFVVKAHSFGMENGNLITSWIKTRFLSNMKIISQTTMAILVPPLIYQCYKFLSK